MIERFMETIKRAYGIGTLCGALVLVMGLSAFAQSSGDSTEPPGLWWQQLFRLEHRVNRLEQIVTALTPREQRVFFCVQNERGHERGWLEHCLHDDIVDDDHPHSNVPVPRGKP